MGNAMAERDALDLAALLSRMRESPSVPEGWDAVLNLSQPAVEALVLSDWEGVPPTRDAPSLLWVAPGEVEGLHEVVEMKTDLPRPAVGLNLANQTVDLGVTIQSGTLQFGKAPSGLLAQLRDKGSSGVEGVSWSPPVPITQADPAQLAATLPVGVRAAGDGRSFSIGLALADSRLNLSSRSEDAWSAQTGDPALAAWLALHKVSHQIGSLTLPAGSEANVLTPAAVAARIAVSTDGEPLLQILTGTSTGAVTPASNGPVPHPDGHDFSLTVGSKAAMAMVVNGYNLGTGVVKLVPVPPSDDQLHWFAQVHEPMVFEGTFGNQDGEIYVTDHAKFYMRFGGSTDDGMKLFTFTDPASTIQLELDLAAHYPVGVIGSGADQLVGLREGDQSVTANGFYEAIVKPRLEAFLTGDIRSDMARVRMTALSELFLRDLTLSGHTLQFEVAALPGELLVAGHLVAGA